MCEALSPAENADARRILDRIVVILTKLGQPGYKVREEPNGYESDKVDCDPDTDSDRKVLFLS
jgi:hypothetical protein